MALRSAGHATKMCAIYEITFLRDIASKLDVILAVVLADASHASILAPISSPLLQQILKTTYRPPTQISLFPSKKKSICKLVDNCSSRIMTYKSQASIIELLAVCRPLMTELEKSTFIPSSHIVKILLHPHFSLKIENIMPCLPCFYSR